MNGKSSPAYWKRYRRVRSNVDSHMAFIHCENTIIDNGEINEISNTTSSSSRTFEQENSESFPDWNTRVVSNHISENDVEGLENSFNGDDISDMSDTGIASASDIEDFDVQSNSSDSSLDSQENDFRLENELCTWVSQFNVSTSALRELLIILRQYHPFLPKDPRTLLKTKTHYNVVDVGGGLYHHFGIKTCLLKEIESSSPIPIHDLQLVSLQINIDGLPLFKSTSTQFWPILGRLVKPYQSKPFTIGLFVGEHKPTSIHEFLESFVNEMTILCGTGIEIPETDHPIGVEIECVICDRPARAFVKQVKGHSAFFGCDKCCQRGIWQGKMTFPETNSVLRSDLQFNEMENEEHHIGHSPFRNLPVGMVSQFPIDYMHLVCLGVMKRLLWLWTKGPLFCRQGRIFTTGISELLENLRSYMPHEFLRKGRSLNEVDRWKATEFRQFLLYTGPVVLKSFLPIQFYKHFMLLFVAIYCLSSPFFSAAYCNYAHQLLVAFVSQISELYGDDQYVYNVHGLIHLADDVSRFGELDKYSSFVFESYLGKLKKLVRKPNYPLQQVIRRLSEKRASVNPGQTILDHGVVKKRHNHGPHVREYSAYQQFEALTLPGVHLSIHRGDNCVLSGEKVGLIRNILSPSDNSTERILVIEWFRGNIGNFFTVPLHSSDLRIFTIAQLCEDINTIKISDITCKCVLLPYKDYYVVIPLSHTLVQ